ncbi:MAG TPA: hypothetical protein VI756_16795 [Blastocatellia bacterium]
MNHNFKERFLMIYSGVLTAVFAITVFCGILRPISFAHADAPPKNAKFDEIDVQRINFREPDGTLRLVISDKAKFPGAFFKNKEIPRPDRQANGMLFLNDEGTEMGGLTFGGEKTKDGQTVSDGHLSFDQYDQDQLFSIDAGQEGPAKRTALLITDRGDYSLYGSMDELMRIKALPRDQQQAAFQKFAEAHPGDHHRIVLARDSDKSAVLRMKDTEGRDRIVIKVGADGAPIMQFLNEGGKVIEQLPRR